MASTTNVPSLSDFPEFTEALARRGQIAVESHAVSDEIAQLRANRPKFDSEDAVTAVLEGRSLPASQSPTAWRSRLEELHERAELLRQAQRLQEQRIREIRTELAERIIPTLQPYVHDLQQRIADAVVVLGKLASEEAEFLAHLREEGIPVEPFHPSGFTDLCLRSDGGRFPAFLQKAEKHHGVKVTR